MANCKRKRTIAAIMALAIVAGAAPAKPISDLIMPELSVSAAEASSSVSWNGFNVAAGGKLTAKFHVNVPDGFAYANTAYAKITCKDVTVEQTFKKIETKNGVKTFSIDLAAKQMTDDITCEIYANSTEKTPLLKTTQTVKGYAEFQLAQSATTAAEAKVYKAMLNYGGYAQIALDYNKTKLANADLSAADKSLASVTADKIGAEYKNVDVLKCEALGSFYAINATLESETELNVYFKPATGVAFNSVKFACTDGGKDYEVKAEEITEGTYKGLFKMKITGIAAKAIGKDLIISVQDSTVPTNVASYKCSVNTFIRSTLINGKEADKNAAAALYLYNQAAVDFFDAERTVDIAIQGPAYYINEYKDKNNAVVGTTKAFLETVGEDEEGNSIEKYLITVPANIADTYGVGRLNITYVNNNKTVTVDSKKCVVNYDDLSQTTVIAVEKDALPVDAEIVVTVTVSEKIDFTFTNPDKHLSLTNENAFKAEEFVTVLEAEEGYALPASITVKENGTIKDANKYYTYDSVTGEIVVFGPLDDLTIVANAVDSNQVSSLLTNLTSDVTFPVTVGDGFSTTLSVTDSSKYKVPKKVTLYGEEDLVEYYMEAEYDETSKKYVDTYYVWDPSANDNKGGWEKVEDSNANDDKTVRQEITEANATPAKPYYINNIKADGTAKLEVFNIDTDVVLVANAIEYYGVTVNTTSVACSSSQISYVWDTKNNKVTTSLKTVDPSETVDKGTKYETLYFALNTTDKDLILPTSIVVKMNGKVLEEGAGKDYVWDADAISASTGTPTAQAPGNPAQGTLTFLKEANGAIEVTVAATEQCTVTTKAVYGVTFSNTIGTYSTGDFTTVIKPNSGYVLPDTIKVTLNDKALTAGVD
ncbi:MAG: hypothetical protein IJM97_07505, partial [Clostridia bacterium]|nr:hypothetical protein [Clostridia bacterium]